MDLDKFFGGKMKFILWAHNSHIGNRKKMDQICIGYLIKKN